MGDDPNAVVVDTDVMTETATTTNQGPAPANEAIVRRFIDEILNQGRFELIPELIHPEYRYIGPDGTELLGRDALADLLRGFRSGFSDLEARVATTVDHSDVVAMTMTLTGTHDGDFDGIPPTGAHLELPIAIFTTLANGQIIEDREYYDTATILHQLGNSPDPN